MRRAGPGACADHHKVILDHYFGTWRVASPIVPAGNAEPRAQTGGNRNTEVITSTTKHFRTPRLSSTLVTYICTKDWLKEAEMWLCVSHTYSTRRREIGGGIYSILIFYTITITSIYN